MKNFALTLSIFTLLMCLAGCSPKANPNRALLNNLTPNMDGLGETHTQNDAGIAVVINENRRMFNDDLRRILLLDKPSMLSSYPVVDN